MVWILHSVTNTKCGEYVVSNLLATLHSSMIYGSTRLRGVACLEFNVSNYEDVFNAFMSKTEDLQIA